LYDDCTATVRTVQGTLFNGSAVDERCHQCGRSLVITESGYKTCPKGCLKLTPDRTAAEVAGGLF
jgi:hypothetical protein